MFQLADGVAAVVVALGGAVVVEVLATVRSISESLSRTRSAMEKYALAKGFSVVVLVALLLLPVVLVVASTMGFPSSDR